MNEDYVKIKLSKEELRTLKEIWEINKKYINREVMKKIGWKTFEDFCGDIFRYGMDKASDDPVTFIKMIRDEKDPIFVSAKEKKKVEDDLKEEFKKAYA